MRQIGVPECTAIKGERRSQYPADRYCVVPHDA
jgi:hypothetical protein